MVCLRRHSYVQRWWYSHFGWNPVEYESRSVSRLWKCWFVSIQRKRTSRPSRNVSQCLFTLTRWGIDFISLYYSGRVGLPLIRHLIWSQKMYRVSLFRLNSMTWRIRCCMYLWKSHGFIETMRYTVYYWPIGPRDCMYSLETYPHDLLAAASQRSKSSYDIWTRECDHCRAKEWWWMHFLQIPMDSLWSLSQYYGKFTVAVGWASEHLAITSNNHLWWMCVKPKLC